MQQEIKILPITKELYPSYYHLVQTTKWGNPMLPESFNTNLWGDVLCIGDIVIGGWVGNLRGNIPLAKWITKSVYFDSYPVFGNHEYYNAYQDTLINTIKHHAQKEGITMLNLTHWVREGNLQIDAMEHNATFLTQLQKSEDELWTLVESKQRNCVRKGEKSGVEFLVCKGEESLVYLSDFQRLRQHTQQHAIKNHAKASMLLKSDNFFRSLFLNNNTILFVGKADNRVATVALMVQSGQTVYYYSGGSDYELNKKYSCSAFTLWKSICYCNELGIKYFDMGGVPTQPTKDHPAYGVYAFKRSFGGEYIEFNGGKIIINKWKYKLLNLLLSQRKLLRLFSKKL